MLPTERQCTVCAQVHAASEPHDPDSLTYQLVFHGLHGRWPTWTDAMAHCLPAVRRLWRREVIRKLRQLGREVPADLLTTCR